MKKVVLLTMSFVLFFSVFVFSQQSASSGPDQKTLIPIKTQNNGKLDPSKWFGLGADGKPNNLSSKKDIFHSISGDSYFREVYKITEKLTGVKKKVIEEPYEKQGNSYYVVFEEGIRYPAKQEPGMWVKVTEDQRKIKVDPKTEKFWRYRVKRR